MRFGVPEGTTRFLDHVRGEMVFNNKEVEDWVMVRSDGNPTYNFVVVCDDVDMQIDHVIRGDDHQRISGPKRQSDGPIEVHHLGREKGGV